MLKLKNIVFLWFVFSQVFLHFNNAQASGDTDHEVSFGVNRYDFHKDLKFIFGDANGLETGYQYFWGHHIYIDPSVGMDMRFVYSKVSGFANKLYQLSPYFGLKPYHEFEHLRLLFGLDLTHWIQKKTFIEELKIHEETNFANFMGFELALPLHEEHGIRTRVTYHMSEFSKKTTYFKFALSYTYTL